ncbi:acetylcholine receptor subunit beta-like 1 isoform X1 [Haliotis rubra]|uniref:acetylcholine receptor subunit beta-like 1 isoform X1 n=1 Tax=Haliotis rubra TaxID=36100 RepID=UPI001EE5AE78|nr:acetylcholine receptor subunit beta-like 1 isoform X1 [Haliotis rubra]
MQVGSSGLLLTAVTLVSVLVEAREQHEERAADQDRLVYDLFSKNGYNPLIRPVNEVNDSLHIDFSLQLSQIISLDEKNQVMKTNVWLQMYWNDTQLFWNTAEYGNIDSIRIRPESVWTPDIVLFNNADGNYEVTYKSNCVIYSTGEVNWIPPAIYQSSCTIDVAYFPFDQQECEMKFGSWTFQGNQLSFGFKGGRTKLDLTDYLKSGTWDLIDCPGTIVNETNGREIRKLIIFKFILRRKTLFYTVNLIIPCVLISFVSVCVFALPADAGEKITLCISILLALVVFLLLVSKILPPSLRIPLIAKYLLFTFIMNIIAILSTVVIINRNYRTPRTHQMPDWVRKIFLYYIPKILLMERPDHDERWKKKEITPPPSYQNTPETRRVPLNMTSDLLELTEIHHPHCKLNPPLDRGNGIDDGEEAFRMTPDLYKATEAVRFIYKHLKTEEDYETVLGDWKYVARVLDRMMLLIFLFVTFGGTVGILVNAPHILEYVDQDKILEGLRG